MATLSGGLRFVERTFFEPESAVSLFFEALNDRDAATAGSLLLPTRSSDNPVLLHRDVLRSQGYTPPADVRVEETMALDLEAGTATITASFSLGGSRHSLDLKLRRDEQKIAGFFHRWRIVGGTYPVDIHASGVDSVRVAGVAIERDSFNNLGAFPGKYEISLAGDPLWEAPPVAVYAGIVDSWGYSRDSEAVLEPNIKSSAIDTISDRIRSYLDRCVRATEIAPEGCPFSATSYLETRNVRWQIAKYPEWKVQLNYSGEAVVTTIGDGQAVVSGQTVSSFSNETSPFQYTDTFAVSGTVAVSNGAIVFTPHDTF
ncbi:hypothetical protein ACQEVF_40325 [Nonomuraea polychroma]|uniref:hypothetical protein n=1 Tax=Nonomuraea polychroma TaxID=46176 RepID=UPI003D9369FA